MGKIRICATIPNLDGKKSWGNIHQEFFDTIKNPDIEITIADLPKAKIKSVSNAFDTTNLGFLHTELAIDAEKNGFDGVAMGCLDEPGVDAAKEVLSIPVVGECEAAMHFASLVGRKFSFLVPGTITGSKRGGDGAYFLEDLARKYGLIQKLSSIRSISAASLDYAKQKENFKNEMLLEAQKAIDEDGADSIIGYGSLDLITFLQSNLKVPVIEPVRSGVIFVESLIKLGISHSKRAFPKPKDYKL
jgi:allantoin racemase